MKIKCFVNQAECFHRGIDAPWSVVEIEVNPLDLSEKVREFVAKKLVKGFQFGSPESLQDEPWMHLVPPTYEGFLEAVKRGMEYEGPESSERRRRNEEAFWDQIQEGQEKWRWMEEWRRIQERQASDEPKGPELKPS